MNDIIVRSITGILFVAAVVGSIYFSIWSTVLLFSLVVLLGLIEFNRLFSGHETFQVNWLTYTGGSLLSFGLVLGVIFDYYPNDVLMVILPVWFLIFSLELFRKRAHPIANMAAFVLQNVYLVFPFLILIYLRTIIESPSVLIGMFVLIWANDSFAYLSGRLFGKTKLFERVSPKKTWEGTIGGALLCILFAVGYALIFDPNQDMIFWGVAALFIIPAAVIGDLLESLMKRSLHIKDSGSLLPGHGGILDRFDATIYATPFFYCWCIIYTYF